MLEERKKASSQTVGTLIKQTVGTVIKQSKRLSRELRLRDFASAAVGEDVEESQKLGVDASRC